MNSYYSPKTYAANRDLTSYLVVPQAGEPGQKDGHDTVVIGSVTIPFYAVSKMSTEYEQGNLWVTTPMGRYVFRGCDCETLQLIEANYRIWLDELDQQATAATAAKEGN